MSVIELVGQVDEQHRLSAELPAHIPPGPVRILVRLPGDEAEEEARAWSQAIAQAWAADWSDPHEDIYTEEDGQPVDHGPK